jgi:hypothetical protein
LIKLFFIADFHIFKWIFVFYFIQVIFSDETYVDIEGSIVQYVRRTSGERIQTSHCINHKPFRKRILFWGAFHADGPIALTPLNGTVNSARYQAILNDHLVPFLENQPLSQHNIFQHDNAPPHTAASTVKFLQENVVEVLQWPPFSPDLNPIENLWGFLKRKIRRGFTNQQDLVQGMFQLWHSNEVAEMCHK